ncbi:hypothetical protein DLJ49_09615 [Rhodovulum sp. 12E13]|uniref:hypothetical protein n=1 Tax=Rhodovulum sp. 12E13 TaxID=2203891 RepID=UPI000E140B4D|nr:hypothetical protein [Rhodovulum sp. 12E13]RDC72863.1 hypothetical protein DLJ49_09615 [Rhodovulum sp. 12E13]
MRPVVLSLAVAALLLPGCDSPSPLSSFAGVPATRVEVAGSTFSVRVAGREAQAVRTNFDLRAGSRGREIVPRAGIAMERASGCRVVPGSLRGDSSVIEARLAC